MKTALRLFVLVLSCSAALGTITVPSWTAAQLLPGESASFATGAPDGNVWATEQAKGQILKINPADGSVTRYPLPANTIPLQITAGPDGNLWFSGGQVQGGGPVSIIGRVTTAGAITIFNYPEARAFTLLSSGPIAGSSDGKVYVVNTASKKIGIINPAASAKVGTSSLVVTEIALAFNSVGITLIASRQSGGIDYCGQSARDCGTLINGVLAPFSLPAGSPSGVSECAAGMICIDTTNTLGATASKFWKCDSSGANCISSDWPDDGCGAGKLSCTSADCVAGEAPAHAYNPSCKDLMAADLTSSPPTLYKINGPGGVNLTDAFLFQRQGGRSKLADARPLQQSGERSVVATGPNSSGDSTPNIGNTAAPNCVPAVGLIVGGYSEGGPLFSPFFPPMHEFQLRVGEFFELSATAYNGSEPYTYSYLGAVPGLKPEKDGDSVVVKGTLAAKGTYSFTIIATDARGCKAESTFTIETEHARNSSPLDGFLDALASAPIRPGH
jgi:hypothetical protein